MSTSMWIWCPKQKIIGRKGELAGKVLYNSVGPNQHINCCLKRGCTCKAMEDRIEEIYGNKNRNNNMA